MVEEWRVAPGFPSYEVSSLGRVRRAQPGNGTQPGRILKPKVLPQGYHEVGLSEQGKKSYVRVHRLVCEAWKGPPPTDQPYACHENDVPDDNRPDNLDWGSRLDNANDALRNDRYLRGESCGSSRHSEATVIAMIAERRSKNTSLRKLSSRYGISRAQISKILNGKYWKHLTCQTPS